MKKYPPIPLSERMRPGDIDEFIGQEHIMSAGKIIFSSIAKGAPFSMILWGDPGTGKTTLARLLSKRFDMDSVFISAISAGVADVRKAIDKGKANKESGRMTLLFIDEIHRFSKAQQDSVLGSVEVGDIVLIGATTENPSFSVISPLLSRARVVKLNRLTNDNLKDILGRALGSDPALIEAGASIASGASKLLVSLSNGDARRMLNLFETAFVLSDDGAVSSDNIEEAVKNSVLYYDRAGDRHYDTISAFIKSMRGSDPDAAVYYLARMIIGGEDPEFIARRMVIFASEDIGNASPQAINIAVSTMTAVKNIGLPEADIILSQCAVFLACSPKSNASYLAIKNAKAAAEKGNFEIPMHIRNAPTSLMKGMGYGKGYQYPHDSDGHFARGTAYLPTELKGERYYHPTNEGSEKQISERLKFLWPERFKD